MRISHEAIYQSLFIEGRGGLRRELILCLRTGRALRMPRARAKRAAWAHVSPDVLISERPEEADDRAIPGHHEGDLIIAYGQVRNRNRRRAHNRIHHPRAPATGAWVATATDHQERAITVGIRSGVDEQSVGTGTGVDAHRTQTLADLGPRERDVRTRPVHHRHRSEGLLRRPTQPVATRHQREHCEYLRWPSRADRSSWYQRSGVTPENTGHVRVCPAFDMSFGLPTPAWPTCPGLIRSLSARRA